MVHNIIGLAGHMVGWLFSWRFGFLSEYLLPIRWSSHQRSRVQRLLEEHLPQDDTCVVLAQKLLPTALSQDPSSHTVEIRPKPPARYVVPKREVNAAWWRHRTTAVEGHWIDSLTGIDGTLVKGYFQEHFCYGDELQYRVVSAEEQ